ncbi:unnamed protein product [Cuscuta campestris]|uniref:Ubiquitin-like protease family profile domain-containing protein n=1 Tax=Cuscuta campestris TaxID=132261 RepID=A0A484MI25_9ASTE|nr:unnamed protein product [Cuscuta campestris]
MGNMEVLKYNDVILRASYMDALGSHCYLNDQVIGVLFLAICDEESRKDAVDHLKLGNKRLVLFAVNDSDEFGVGQSGSQWSILIFDRTKHSFLHLDTMQGENHIPAFKLYDSVKQYVGVESASIKEGAKNKKKNKNKKKAANTAVASIEVSFKECEAPQQTNGYDCGVYVMAIAKAVSDFCLSGKTDKEVDWLSFVVKNVDASIEETFRQEIMRLIEDLRNSD